MPDCRRVLIIDDDESALTIWSAWLRTEGFDVYTAETGAIGTEIATAIRPDVVVADLRLPDMSGVEVVTRLRQQGLTSTFIVITAFPSLDSAFAAGRSGAFQYIDSLLSCEELAAVIADACQPGAAAASALQDAAQDSATASAGREPVREIDPRIRRAMQIIDAEGSCAIAIGQLARQLGLSGSRLSHLFRSAVGIPLHAFVIDRRMRRAARLLSSSSDHVRQIAYRTGVTDIRNFREAFRRRFGMSPTEYRRVHGGVSVETRPASTQSGQEVTVRQRGAPARMTPPSVGAQRRH